VVFGQIYGRSVVVAMGGGAVIGATIGLLIGVWAVTTQDDGIGDMASAPLWGAYFGGAFGLILGLVGGLIVATVAAIGLVPFRSAGRTMVVVRVPSLLVVAVFMALLFGGATGGRAAVAAIAAAGLIGAWMSAPFLVGWYLRRVGAAR
jgi:hypothetical protein